MPPVTTPTVVTPLMFKFSNCPAVVTIEATLYLTVSIKSSACAGTVNTIAVPLVSVKSSDPNLTPFLNTSIAPAVYPPVTVNDVCPRVAVNSCFV